MHFSDAITEYSFDCKVRKLSPKSISNYQKQLKYLQRYMEQEFQIKNVEQVRTAHIKMFLAMMDDKQRKPRYINDLFPSPVIRRQEVFCPPRKIFSFPGRLHSRFPRSDFLPSACAASNCFLFLSICAIFFLFPSISTFYMHFIFRLSRLAEHGEICYHFLHHIL